MYVQFCEQLVYGVRDSCHHCEQLIEPGWRSPVYPGDLILFWDLQKQSSEESGTGGTASSWATWTPARHTSWNCPSANELGKFISFIGFQKWHYYSMFPNGGNVAQPRRGVEDVQEERLSFPGYHLLKNVWDVVRWSEVKYSLLLVLTSHSKTVFKLH